MERVGRATVNPAQDVFCGGHSGYVRNLDGNVRDVAWSPFSPSGEEENFAWQSFGP